MTEHLVILTGEYPPQHGGVSDYTRLLATRLAALGNAVTIFAPPAAVEKTPALAVAVCRLPDHFGPRGLVRLSQALALEPRRTRLLVQYVPHAFGWKAMNVPFCFWVLWRKFRHRNRIDVMFHEIVFPLPRRPLRHAVLGIVTRGMAALLLWAADRVFVSTPAWYPHARRWGPAGLPCEWLPIPSNIPADPDPAAIAIARAHATGGNPAARVVGHFGTYGDLITSGLQTGIARLLDARPEVRVLLIGDGDGFRANLLKAVPGISDRVLVTGRLPADGVSAHLCACDLVMQPFPDGVSARRTSLMAAIANGVPVVTSDGDLTEPVWRGVPGITLVPAGEDLRLGDAASKLLANPATLAELRHSVREFYERHFSMERTVRALCGSAE
ncbi:MAG: glycosyltransferase family 4 protein [Gemmataceae bacterium]